jgi:hypothetical protein
LWLEGNIYTRAKSLTGVHDSWITCNNMEKISKIEILGHSKESESSVRAFTK